MSGKKRILIAEDEKPMANALKVKLTSKGYEVVNAFSGQEALDSIKKENFNLILLDLVMPEKDGFEVLELLQKQKIKTPIVVSSNLSQAEDVKKAKDLGAKDFFIKSDTPINKVVEYVEKYLK